MTILGALGDTMPQKATATATDRLNEASGKRETKQSKPPPQKEQSTRLETTIMITSEVDPEILNRRGNAIGIPSGSDIDTGTGGIMNIRAATRLRLWITLRQHILSLHLYHPNLLSCLCSRILCLNCLWNHNLSLNCKPLHKWIYCQMVVTRHLLHLLHRCLRKCRRYSPCSRCPNIPARPISSINSTRCHPKLHQ